MNNSNRYPNIYPKVVLVGDSLTEHSFDYQGNFGGKLYSLLKRKADVINRGFSGYTTATLKLVLPKIFNPEYLKDVACLTLCIGANDSWFQIDNKNVKFNPGLSVEDYKSNLVDICEFLLKNGLDKTKILLITPPSFKLEDWTNWCLQNLDNPEMKDIQITKTAEHTRKYADAMIEVGNELNIKCFDAFELTNRPSNINRCFVDGLHYSETGAGLIYELIKDDVEQLVNKYRGTDMVNFPTYNDIDFNNLNTFFTG